MSSIKSLIDQTAAPAPLSTDPFTVTALTTATKPAADPAYTPNIFSVQSLAVAQIFTTIGTDGDDALAGDNTPGNIIEGRAGADYIIGTNDSDWTLDSSDSINGGEGYDTIYACNGNDTVDGDAGFDRIYGGQGDDLITDLTGGCYAEGNKGNDWLKGGDWYTTLNGGDGNDTLLAGSWGAVLIGENGRDSLTGGNGNDSLYGDADNDTLIGGNGNDSLTGGVGHDSINGGIGNDVLVGDMGADTLVGGDGNDALYDGVGNDSLDAGAGDDRLVAMEGNDTMTGGAGADLFDFRRASFEKTGVDRLVDFTQGQDRIYIGYSEDAAQIIARAQIWPTSVVLTFGEGATVTLANFTATLRESDFIYG